MIAAAARGNMELINYLCKQDWPDSEKTLQFAAREGSYDVIKELHESFDNKDTKVWET